MNFGDVVDVDFGTPVGSEAGYRRPGIVITADSFLRFRPSTVFVVPLTSSPRTFPSHVVIEADRFNGLDKQSCALVEQLRAVTIERCGETRGNIGPVASKQVLDIMDMIVGMP